MDSLISKLKQKFESLLPANTNTSTSTSTSTGIVNVITDADEAGVKTTTVTINPDINPPSHYSVRKSRINDRCVDLDHDVELEKETVTRTENGCYISAWLEAYNNHLDIVISPDDCWLTVCLMFSEYVSQHAEELRDKFVSHDGKKKLTVIINSNCENPRKVDWSQFFSLIVEQVHKETKDGIVPCLMNNFSTTDDVFTMLSVASVMDTMKHYFEYSCCIPACGIRKAIFLGQLEDYQKLVSKLTQLRAFVKHKEFNDYLDRVEVIFQQFIDTYQGNVNRKWWNKVMDITHGRQGSGSITYIDGWIIHLYGLNRRSTRPSFKRLSVPVKVENHLTFEKYDININGGFSGYHVSPEFAVRPRATLNIYKKVEDAQDTE
jgi:hypothetical protein